MTSNLTFLDFTVLSLISFIFGWLRIGSHRFQCYVMHESVEEKLRRLCSSIKMFEELLSADWIGEEGRSAVIQEQAEKVLEDTMCGGKAIRDLTSVLGTIARSGFRVCEDLDKVAFASENTNSEMRMDADKFAELLRVAKQKSDRLLGACRDEKRKLEGCIKGNIRALRFLCGKRPISERTILRVVSDRADDPTEKFTWRGKVK